MDTEAEANLSAEPIDAPVEVVEAEQAEANTEDLDSLVKLGLGDEQAKEEPKIIEIEIDGKMVKVSEDAKDYLLRQADYTKKTTEVAREREALQAQAAEVEQSRQFQEAIVNAKSLATALDMQIQELAGMPIDGLSQEQVNSLQSRLLRLQAHRQEVDFDIKAITESENAKLSEQFGKQRQEALAAAAEKIPNFTDKRRIELEALAVDLGIPKEDVETTADPAAYEILHLADIGRKFLERQRAARQVENAQSVSPAAEVGGRATATKDPNKMTTEEWMKHRQKQVS